EHAVEKQVELVSFRALLREGLAFAEATPVELRVAPHDRGRELALELGLDRGRHRRRVLLATRRVRPVRLAVPALEVDRARLLDELAVVVVEPVARAGTRAGGLSL